MAVIIIIIAVTSGFRLFIIVIGIVIFTLAFVDLALW